MTKNVDKGHLFNKRESLRNDINDLTEKLMTEESAMDEAKFIFSDPDSHEVNEIAEAKSDYDSSLDRWNDYSYKRECKLSELGKVKHQIDDLQERT